MPATHKPASPAAQPKTPVLQRAAGETVRSHDDASSEGGAAVLAQTIQTYWNDRGAVVTVQVERLEGIDGRRPVFRVVSDLAGGLPRR
jgi:hypothetical protein